MGREWGGDGNGRSVYEQPGTKVDGILLRKGGFPSKKKGNGKEVEKESARGSRTKGIAP